MSGYTLNGIVGRMVDLETKTHGGYYVSCCWLAMGRSSGATARKALEAKVFGQAAPTSTFRNAWRIATKSYAEGFPLEKREHAKTLELDEAIKWASECLEAHKLALEVSNMKDYEELCHLPVKPVVDEAEAKAEAETKAEAEAKAKEEAEAKAKEEAEAEEKARREAELNPVDPLVGLKHAASVLTLEQAVEFAGWLNNHIQLAMSAKADAEAKAEGKADFDPAAELAKAKAEGDAKRAKAA